MEFMEYLLLILVVIVGLIGFVFVFYKIQANSSKFKQLQATTTPFGSIDIEKIKKIHNNEISYIENSQIVTIANLKKELTALQGKYNQMAKKVEKNQQKIVNDSVIDEDSIENLQENYEIDPVKAAEYMKKIGLNPNVLTNPALAQEGWKRLHENKLAAMAFGVLVPKGGGPVTPITDILKKNGNGVSDSSIDPIDALFESGELT